MKTSKVDTMGDACYNYSSDDSHLLETILMLGLSTLVIYMLGIPQIYKKLVLTCRREYKFFNKNVKYIELAVMISQVLILAALSYMRYNSKGLVLSLNSTTLMSIIQILIYFSNPVLGCLLAVVFLGFTSCGAAFTILFSDQIFTSWLHVAEGIFVYIVAPILFFMKYNFCFDKLYQIPDSKFVGFWLFLQISWSIYEGASILSFVNLEGFLCPTKRLEVIMTIFPSLDIPALSHKIPMTFSVIGLGFVILNGYIMIEKTLKPWLSIKNQPN